MNSRYISLILEHRIHLPPFGHIKKAKALINNKVSKWFLQLFSDLSMNHIGISDDDKSINNSVMLRTEGTVFSAAEYVYKRELGFVFKDSKKDWSLFFKTHKVPTPKVYEFGDVLPHSDLIAKPFFGNQGKGIEKYSWSGCNYKGSNGNTLSPYSISVYALENNMQLSDFIDTRTADSQFTHNHFRIITIKKHTTKTPFVHSIFNLQSTYNFVSNQHNGGISVTPTDKSKLIMKEVVRKCIKLHDKIDMFSVGWDVILDEMGNYYFLEGNFTHSVNSYYEGRENKLRAVKYYYQARELYDVGWMPS